MVEGKLQREGEVIHVIVKYCYGFSEFLRDMTEVENNEQLVQTLSRADENDGEPFPSQNKKTQVRKVVQGDTFPVGRNFK